MIVTMPIQYACRKSPVSRSKRDVFVVHKDALRLLFIYHRKTTLSQLLVSREAIKSTTTHSVDGDTMGISQTVSMECLLWRCHHHGGAQEWCGLRLNLGGGARLDFDLCILALSTRAPCHRLHPATIIRWPGQGLIYDWSRCALKIRRRYHACCPQR